MTRLFRLSLLAALFPFAWFTAHPAIAQGTDAILILDASGSMWGQVDGQTKITAARRAVDSILSKWKPQDRLGLMAYGHRTKGDCKDIELIVPAGSFDAARIKSAVAALNPKGKTPMADSLREAARVMRSTERKATVILVSDGIETCSPDPCKVAADLKKSGVGFVAHVIGFDVTDPVAKSQLQCIARETGGVYLDARNASGLEQALGRAVDATQGASVKTEAPPAKQAEDPFKGRNFRGIARLAEGADPISDTKSQVNWSIFKPGAEGKKGSFVNTFYGVPGAGSLEPGSYVLEVVYGQVTRQFPLSVEKGKPAQMDVVLNAAYVTSEGAVTGGGKADKVTWEIHSRDGRYVGTDYSNLPRFVVGAGDYVLTLSKGASKTKQDFSVAAGDSINVAMALDVGKLLVSGSYSANGPKVEQGIAVEVHKPGKADGTRGEWIATTYEPLSQFDLPAGDYDVTVLTGAAKRTAKAQVASGGATEINVVLDAGVLGVGAPGSNAVEIFSAEKDINNRRPWITTLYDQSFTLALNAGDYVVVASFGESKVERPFSIAPGKRTNVEIKR